ncbi:hypothetical protein MHU86_15732 [Fragilaria crotonensis]|nr:hypothetical protein MHU86_15732 [Fragilaria crotonensis]
MQSFPSAFDSLPLRRSYAHLLGMCLLFVTATILFSLETIRSEASTTIVSDRRRVLTHEAGAPSVRSNLTFPISLRASSYQPKGRHQLDFFVAGFPKCGTTTMLYAFANHNETDIGKTEKCVILNAKVSDSVALNRLDDAVGELSAENGMKRGIKCPSGIKNSRSLERMHNHSPRARLIVGIRHPVLFFQSYYNYRVTEIYDRNLTERIPPAEGLIGKTTWKDVCTDTARFDLYLKQLGKTNMTTAQLEEFVGRPHMAVRPNLLKVFLYSLDQIDDTDENRSSIFRSELQRYLGLRSPIPSFSHENLNNFVGNKGHPETMDICQSRYDSLRQVLVGHGTVMETWIRKEFMMSPDVFVANTKHFLESIRTWRMDPCPLRQVSAQSKRPAKL